jgi:hypothetical protein
MNEVGQSMLYRASSLNELAISAKDAVLIDSFGWGRILQRK